jgi:hypothetical protein
VSDKIARLGIERDNDLMYYIKNGDVWATPRKQKGQPKGKAQKIAATGLELDYSKYIYYLDGDGDVARKARALGGGRRTKAKTAGPTKSTAPIKAAKPTTASATPKRAGTKSPAQLDREIEECLALVKKDGNGNGNGNGGTKSNGNGTKFASKPAAKKTTKKKTKKKRG